MLQKFIGRYVIVRSGQSGVHAGILQSVELTGDTCAVVLAESRRLWRWWSAKGVGLDGVSEYGMAPRLEVRVGVQMAVPKMVRGCCEILTCSDVGEASIRQMVAVQS
jgi:hypothetical protein